METTEETKFYEKQDRHTKYFYKVEGGFITALYRNLDGSRSGINKFKYMPSYTFNDCSVILETVFQAKLDYIKKELKM